MREYSTTLNQLRLQPDATPDVMADGLVWPDEYPIELGHSDSDFNNYFCSLINLRTSKYLLVDVPCNVNELFSALEADCPGWAFCDKNRFHSNLKKTFFELRDRAQEKIEKHFGIS